MGPLAWTVFLCIVSSARSDGTIFNETASATPSTASFSGYAFEMLMAKLDYMQRSVLELQTELTKQREETARGQADCKAHMTVGIDHMQNSFLELQTELAKHREEAAQSQNNSDNSLIDIKRAVQNNFDSMRRLEDDAGRRFTLLQERSWQILTRVTTKANLFSYVPYRSCSDISNAQSGAYIIQANDKSNPFMAYCQRDMNGVGIWLVIQHRFDGSLDFYRNWTEYRNGFGDIEQEFWIGLERLYQLTSGRPHELMVEMKDFKWNYKFALYTAFEIDSEIEQYKLKTLGAYNGTAGDSLSYHKNMKFSTYDRDNDGNCVRDFAGAWWYNACFQSNLNARYKDIQAKRLINWNSFTKTGLAFSRMMIRPKE